MKQFPGQVQAVPDQQERIITVFSPEFSCSTLALLSVSMSSGIWFSANAAVAYPFRLSYPVVVKQLCIMNGSSAGGNVDLGLYTSSFVRLASTGSTGGTGNSLWQFIDITDTPLDAGKIYYLAGARDNITANRQRFGGNGGAGTPNTLQGILTGASQFPLPDPLVVSTPATSSVQFMGMACRLPH